MWLSWQSGRLCHQRSAVRVQSLAIISRAFIYFHLCWEDKNKEKEAANGSLKLSQIERKNLFDYSVLYLLSWTPAQVTLTVFYVFDNSLKPVASLLVSPKWRYAVWLKSRRHQIRVRSHFLPLVWCKHGFFNEPQLQSKKF